MGIVKISKLLTKKVIVEIMIIIEGDDNIKKKMETGKNRERDRRNDGEQQGSVSCNSQSKGGSIFHCWSHRHTRLYSWRIHYLLDISIYIKTITLQQNESLLCIIYPVKEFLYLCVISRSIIFK